MGSQFPPEMKSDRVVMRSAMKAELLDAETEQALARAWRDEGDEEALHRLVTAYMRLAISMAGKYRRYGAPMNDLIQEAGVGLMKAVACAHRLHFLTKIPVFQHAPRAGEA